MLNCEWSTPETQGPGGMWVSEQVNPAVLRAMLDVRAGSLGLPGVERSLLSRGPENGLTSEMAARARLAHCTA